MTAAFTLCCWGGSVLSSRLARETWSIWENTGELTGTGEPYSPAHTHSQADRIRCSWIQECLAVCAQPPARAALISFGAIRSDCNTNEWYTGKAQMWAVKQLGMGAEQAPELLQGTWGGCAGFVHWDHPAPPCFQGCWCHPAAWWQLIPHRALCSSQRQCQRELLQTRECSTQTQHTLPWQERTYSPHPVERGCWGDAQGLLSTPGPIQPWQGAPCCSPAAAPTPGCLQRCFSFPLHPLDAILPSQAQVNNLTS